MYLIDTSIWVEISQGTEKAKKCVQLISKHECYTTGIVIAEMSKWCYANSVDAKEKISWIDALCNGILEPNRISQLRTGFLWKEANKQAGKKKRNIGLVDCLIAATAEENDLTVLTKDKHFKTFEGIKKEII